MGPGEKDFRGVEGGRQKLGFGNRRPRLQAAALAWSRYRPITTAQMSLRWLMFLGAMLALPLAAQPEAARAEVPAATTLLLVEGVGASRIALADRYDAAVWVCADEHDRRTGAVAGGNRHGAVGVFHRIGIDF